MTQKNKWVMFITGAVLYVVFTPWWVHLHGFWHWQGIPSILGSMILGGVSGEWCAEWWRKRQ